MDAQDIVKAIQQEHEQRMQEFARTVQKAGGTVGDGVPVRPGLWQPAGTLGEPNVYVAACLKNGKILAVAAQAYRYDGQAWSTAGDFPLRGVLIANSQLVPLKDGTALTTGYDPGTQKFRGAVYDPAANAWQLTGNLNESRRYYAAALLQNGHVLVAGGLHMLPSLASCELYDPVSRQWTPTAPLNTARSDAAAASIHGGTVVLVAGGRSLDNAGNFETLASVERYDANKSTPQWTTVSPMHLPRQGASAVALPDGRVVVAGGSPNGGTLEVYDPEHDCWEDPVTLCFDRTYTPAMAVLNERAVLIAGGGTNKVAEIYDPVKRTSSPTAAMSVERLFPGYCTAKDGSVIVVGGVNGSTFLPWDTAERFRLK